MSTVPSSPPAAVAPHAAADGGRRPDRAALGRQAAFAATIAACGLAWWWLATHHMVPPEHDAPAAAPATDVAAGDVVVLPAATTGIEVAAVGLRSLRGHLTVPGRLDYDARYRLDYGAPVDGIVSRVLVQVRQRVARGDSLAEISSPDVGTARDDIRRREADQEIARHAAEWTETIAGNVDALLAYLARRPSLADVEAAFEGRVLGAYREAILGAYSRLVFVEKVSDSTAQLGAGGVLSGRIVEERTSNLEVTRANYLAACEEAQFAVRQKRDQARAELAQADRLVQIARENLRTLVGSRLDTDVGGRGSGTVTIEEEGEVGTGATGATNGLSTLVLRTPFDGLVEDVFVARGERVKAGDRMFVVADTGTLWVRAQIHERQWTTVEVAEGQEVRVKVPGAGDHDTTARVSHVGATVEADSRSVPLVAELENDDAHYKPGMFVWVDLPQGEPREVLAIPAAGVMRHQGEAFVFVPAGRDEEGRPRYRRVGITTGIEEGGYVEVTRGLAAGDEVVTTGAFTLKSELLLEDESAPGAEGGGG
ncbi:MAG: efflux RND transporter periplasmic adaptor subunit [Planctomycetes bacterium]|nr:efflux RND transporter periplasmic adaptor subunit [Planctomycetota bacterium]MBM4056645.1 efflux RND transporter periplasmic adaptor subunit [Planctomycetota bacterium]